MSFVIDLLLFLDCKTVGFFLKISKEIGKAWRKSLTRAKHAREKKPTVRFPYNEFVPTRGSKNVVELSKICSQLCPLCEFNRLGCYYCRSNPVILKQFLALLPCEM